MRLLLAAWPLMLLACQSAPSTAPSTEIIPGGGYATAAVRMEIRPHLEPFDRATIIHILDSLQEHGVRAWWYSVARPPSLLLYPSEYLAYDSLAQPVAYYQWIAEQAHARGISLFSHYCLHAAPQTLAQHPDWGCVYLAQENGQDVVSPRSPCLRSPYGDRLKQAAGEIVGALGFDGIWFDCTQLYEWDRWLCACHRCQTAFREETGLDMPRQVDFTDASFKRLIHWRYQFQMDYWLELIDAVKSTKPEALLAFNVKNRLNDPGSQAAIPLWQFPGDALLASEVDWRPQQALLQMKYLRAMMDHRYAPESWIGFSDATHVFRPKGPSPDPSGLLQFGLSCQSCGGHASYGAAVDQLPGTLPALSQGLLEAADYVGGEPLRHLGLVLSQATMDFGHLPGQGKSSSAYGDAFRAWQAAHGMHYLLNGLHLPSEVLLDDQLTLDRLRSFDAVVLPDVRCLSDEAATALLAYAEQGGTLLLTAETGSLDSWGERRPKPVFDAALGIVRRDSMDQALIIKTDGRGDFPAEMLISGRGKLFFIEESQAWPARVVYSESRMTPTGPQLVDPPAVVKGSGIVEVRYGQGMLIYLATDLCRGYAGSPNRRSRELIKTLLASHVSPPFEVEAPPNVFVSAWRKEGHWILHLLNQPPSTTFLSNSNAPQQPEDVAPTGPIVIRWPAETPELELVAGSGALTHRRKTSGQSELRLDRLERRAVIRWRYDK